MLLPQFSDLRILVVGDVMLDAYLHGLTHRVSPEAPVPILSLSHREHKAGGAANVAKNCAALGCFTSLLGFVGLDDNASCLNDLLAEAGVHSLLQPSPIPTIVKTRLISRGQQLLRFDEESPSLSYDCSLIDTMFHAVAHEYDAIILSDYNKGVLHSCDKLISHAIGLGKKVFVDPKGTNYDRYAGATVITPNESEFQTAVGPYSSDAEMTSKALLFKQKLNISNLLVTRGEKGMVLYSQDGHQHTIQSTAKDVFDVTGAGDTVISTLAACHARNLPIETSAIIANTAAGIVVSRIGACSLSFSELQLEVSSSVVDNFKFGYISISDLVNVRSILHSRSESLVMTNGCFDLLHPGHIDYLQRAKALGNYLVVALNDDASIKRLKGPMRPVNDVNSRIALLQALDCVDWVVIFSDDTPEHLYSQILPDILVKGGDYEGLDIVGSSSVINNGGKVVTLPFLCGYSSSAIVNKILMASTQSLQMQ